MEKEKEEIKISLSTALLLVAVIIVVMGIIIYKLKNNNTVENQEYVTDLNESVNVLQDNNNVGEVEQEIIEAEEIEYEEITRELGQDEGFVITSFFYDNDNKEYILYGFVSKLLTFSKEELDDLVNIGTFNWYDDYGKEKTYIVTDEYAEKNNFANNICDYAFLDPDTKELLLYSERKGDNYCLCVGTDTYEYYNTKKYIKVTASEDTVIALNDGAVNYPIEEFINNKLQYFLQFDINSEYAWDGYKLEFEDGKCTKIIYFDYT